MNELITLSDIKPEVIFSSDGKELDLLLDNIEKHAKSLVFDVETPRGRADITSLAYKVAKSKTALDNMGKEHVSILKAQAKVVDNGRKKMRESLELLKEEVRAPLTDYENREKDRVEAIEKKIARLDFIYQEEAVFDYTIEQLSNIDVLLGQFIIDDSFEEYKNSTIASKERKLKSVKIKLDKAINEREEKLELERLRREDEERKLKEREEEIRKEAAEKAKQEAEAKAKKEADDEAARVAAEKKKLEDEKLEAEREKVAAQERAEEAERAQKEAQREREEEEKRQEIEAKEREKVRIEREKLEKEQAIQDERARVEREQKEAIAAEEKRKANEEHRRKINRAAMEAIFEVVDIPEEACMEVIKKIALGKVPNVSIRY